MKRRYVTVSNKLGDAILTNTGIDALISANIGGMIVSTNIYITTTLGLFAVALIVGRRVSQKYIDLNTPNDPSKRIGQPITTEQTK